MAPPPLAELTTLLEQAEDVLGGLSSFDLDGIPAEALSEVLPRLHRLRGRLDVGEARCLGRWDAAKVWRAEGASTAASWMARELRLPHAVARQRLRHARAMRELPALETAWRAGDLDRSHVTTLLGVRNERTKAAFEKVHEHLIDTACTHQYRTFKNLCDRFEQLADPDGAEQGADEGRAAREAHLSQTIGGMWLGRMTFDPVSGEIVASTLRGIEKELFDADWAEARERLGREPTILDLARTPAQRRADAMTEMAIRARSVPAGARRPAPLFTVVVGYETLVGPVLELFNGTAITPGTAAAWLSEADVERIVFDGPSRVVDVGVQRRFFTGATRRAVEVRDRTCVEEGCDAPPERLQVDHVEEASKGGETTQANGQLRCDFHNQLRYRQRAAGEGGDGDEPPA